MCDSPRKSDYTGWCGWVTLPLRATILPRGEWVDLTHPLSEKVPRGGLFPPPRLARVSEMPAHPLNVTRLETVVHIGTHVDAPRHMFVDGPPMEAVPPERFIGPGVVIRIHKPPLAVIDENDLANATPRIEPGDIVAIDTGWEAKWGTAEWDRQPSLSPAAARWLRDKPIKLLAVDSQTPELALELRGDDFAWPVHCTLLSQGILIAEQLANLHRLAGQHVEFLFAPLPIRDSDGSPARVLARPLAE